MKNLIVILNRSVFFRSKKLFSFEKFLTEIYVVVFSFDFSMSVVVSISFAVSMFAVVSMSSVVSMSVVVSMSFRCRLLFRCLLLSFRCRFSSNRRFFLTRFRLVFDFFFRLLFRFRCFDVFVFFEISFFCANACAEMMFFDFLYRFFEIFWKRRNYWLKKFKRFLNFKFVILIVCEHEMRIYFYFFYDIYLDLISMNFSCERFAALFEM